MKTYNSIILLSTVVIALSCNREEQNNGSEKPTVGNHYWTEHYSNGQMKSKYAISANKTPNGQSETFYENGKLESKGQWLKGRKYGWFSYFDKEGKLEKKIEFVDLKDTTFSRLNQIIKFAPNGDTILGGASLFYLYYDNGDTISNGQPYEFKIVLKGHVRPNAHIRFCNFDENYQFVGNEKCEGQEMTNFEEHLTFNHYKPGENYLRGVIYNYEGRLDDNTGKFVKVYFSRKYYVK